MNCVQNLILNFNNEIKKQEIADQLQSFEEKDKNHQIVYNKQSKEFKFVYNQPPSDDEVVVTKENLCVVEELSI